MIQCQFRTDPTPKRPKAPGFIFYQTENNFLFDKKRSTSKCGDTKTD